MTGRPSCRQRTTTSFCTDGTSSSGICAPAAPRRACQALTLTLTTTSFCTDGTSSSGICAPAAPRRACQALTLTLTITSLCTDGTSSSGICAPAAPRVRARQAPTLPLPRLQLDTQQAPWAPERLQKLSAEGADPPALPAGLLTSGAVSRRHGGQRSLSAASPGDPVQMQQYVVLPSETTLRRAATPCGACPGAAHTGATYRHKNACARGRAGAAYPDRRARP